MNWKTLAFMVVAVGVLALGSAAQAAVFTVPIDPSNQPDNVIGRSYIDLDGSTSTSDPVVMASDLGAGWLDGLYAPQVTIGSDGHGNSNVLLLNETSSKVELAIMFSIADLVGTGDAVDGWQLHFDLDGGVKSDGTNRLEASLSVFNLLVSDTHKLVALKGISNVDGDITVDTTDVVSDFAGNFDITVGEAQGTDGTYQTYTIDMGHVDLTGIDTALLKFELKTANPSVANIKNITITPEPATMGLLAVGGLLALVRRRRRA